MTDTIARPCPDTRLNLTHLYRVLEARYLRDTQTCTTRVDTRGGVMVSCTPEPQEVRHDRA